MPHSRAAAALQPHCAQKMKSTDTNRELQSSCNCYEGNEIQTPNCAEWRGGQWPCAPFGVGVHLDLDAGGDEDEVVGHHDGVRREALLGAAPQRHPVVAGHLLCPTQKVGLGLCPAPASPYDTMPAQSGIKCFL